LVIQTAKPIQSQFKPIQSQFVEKGKIDANFAFTKDYEENPAMGKETKPIQTQSKHVLSGYVLSKVEGVERAICILVYITGFIYTLTRLLAKKVTII